ncbi:MAG: FAD-dependent oxidoreductase, partial [Candidatus Saccharimonas sp.]|nr:FAD-dependent oxidoreductase [Planctomycetaceae bacterium]
MNSLAKLVVAVIFASTLASTRAAEPVYDVVVYGGTSGGVTAAIQSARMGKSVVLIEPSGHIGGLTSGGLGATDIGNKGAIGGLSREFYRKIGAYYLQASAWKFGSRDAYVEKRKALSEN